jgi:Flavin containing amine oxidoreductase
MLASLRVKPTYNSRVTKVEQLFLFPHRIFPNLGRFWPRFPFFRVTIQDTQTGNTRFEYFGHVVSTTTFAALRTINTESVTMNYEQRQAIRTLGYGPATKVGIKFTSRWWEQNGQQQFGGSSYTDRQSRVVVYPSYGLGESGPGVLMATYNWCVGFPTPSRFAYTSC